MQAVFSEARLARTLGVARDALQRVRPAGEWARVEGEVRLSRAGVLMALAKIQGLVDAELDVAFILKKARAPSALVDAGGVEGAGEDAEGRGGASDALAGQPVCGVVAGTVLGATKNRRILRAEVDGVGEVRVMVRDCLRFAPGAGLRLLLVEEDLYELVGPEPRSRRESAHRAQMEGIGHE